MDPRHRMNGDDQGDGGIQSRPLLFIWRCFLVVGLAAAAWTLVVSVRDLVALSPEDVGAFFGRIAHGYNQAKGG